MKGKSILMIEDEAGIGEMTKMFLINQGYDVVLAENGERALQLLESVQPDLILLDIEMPGIDGFTVCKKIRKKLSVPIIFLTVRRDTMDKIKCFELGGDDYVTKPFDFSELEARIRANIRRYFMHLHSNQEILSYGDLEIHLHNFKCFVDGNEIHLSTKEMELLILLAKHPNRVWSQEQIYDKIWNFDANGNVETVKVHISYLRKKLEKDLRNPKYIKTVRGFGYMFSG